MDTSLTIISHSLSSLTHHHLSLTIIPHSLSFLTHHHPSLTIIPHSLSSLTHYLSSLTITYHYHPSLTITHHPLSPITRYHPSLTITPHLHPSLSPLTHYHSSPSPLTITPHSLSLLTFLHPSLSPLTHYHSSPSPLTITHHSITPHLHPSPSPITHYHPSLTNNPSLPSPQIKKLVYVYLVRYAEEQQDLALLSISTFQKALKDPNQLIRASALRVLSSIRVPIIAPVMMLSIKESASDMSPYVRKAAAHAIPKLYSLDPEMKEGLIEIIEQLLKDKTTVVLFVLMYTSMYSTVCVAVYLVLCVAVYPVLCV